MSYQLKKSLLLVLLIASAVVDPVSGSGADFVRAPNDTVTNIAFGSCHNSRKMIPNQPNIWKAVNNERPDVFLWTGDAVYPPKRKVASVNMLRTLFDNMHSNDTIGYNQLTTKYGIFGTWDDHDFGGNDMGHEMPEKVERAAAYYDFLKLPHFDNTRSGLYYSVNFGDAPDHQVKVLFLDTRWNRGRHCFPSIASKIKLGAGLSAAMRWMLAGFNINRWWPFWDCMGTSVLGEEQWNWLESELENSQASVHIVVSSIQVLTTNPTVEGWGHFPNERQRLLRILGHGISGLFVLSGDVHHAEILDPLARLKAAATGDSKINFKQSFLEVTSSGMTHDCSQPFYGKMCQPLLEHYNRNRFANKDNYYIGRNYGQVAIDWEGKSAEVLVKNEEGTVVLRTGSKSFQQDELTAEEVHQVTLCVDGHWIQPMASVLAALMAVFVISYSRYSR